MMDADRRTLDALGHAPDEDHIPVPLAHRPTVHAEVAAETLTQPQRFVIASGPPESEACEWIACENPVEVEP